MLTKFFQFFSLAFLLLNVGCSTNQKINSLKPAPSDNTPMTFKNNTSYISMPLQISVTEIENQLNKNLIGLLYEDNNIEDDKTELKIWKTNAIKTEEKNGKLVTTLPLKIWTKFKYGTEFLGLYDTREINLNGNIIISSNIKFNNWKLNTNSKIETIEWIESPTISISGKQLPITYIINPALSIFKNKITSKIDDAIEKHSDFKPHVLSALEKLSTPFLTSEKYDTWFKLIPNEVYLTDIALVNSKINFDLGLKCNLQTIVGAKPKSNFDGSSIVFKSVTKMTDKTTLSIAAVSTYESASRIITNNFKGVEFGSGRKKVKIKNVDLWQKDGRIIIALDMTGSLDGKVYLVGIPTYNQAKNEIYFEQLDYILDTKGILTKTANWLLQGAILKKIEESCRYSIKENLEEARKNILPFLNNYSPMKGVFINGNLNQFEFEKIELNNKGIIAFITTNAKMNIKIEGLE